MLYKVCLFLGSVFILVCAILLYGYLNIKYNFGVPCMLNQIFGIYCSGCGLTRAGLALLRLDFYQAFRYNAFSIVFIPGLFFIGICFIWEQIFNKTSIISKIPVWFWVLISIAFLGYGIMRNFIPYLQPVNL